MFDNFFQLQFNAEFTSPARRTSTVSSRRRRELRFVHTACVALRYVAVQRDAATGCYRISTLQL